MKYSIIVPCYNEEGNIEQLVLELEGSVRNRHIEFILVENGSIDNTRQELYKICKGKEHFKIIEIDKNIGYGYGICQGIKNSTGDYVGWIHADLQIKPKEIMKFVDISNSRPCENLFLKGIRQKRPLIERFFTFAMSIIATIILKTRLYDIGAVPVLFKKDLMDYDIDLAPNDFSIETFIYYKAKKSNLEIVRKKVVIGERNLGKSSWNTGIKSKIRQGLLIYKDILKISKGIKVY